MSPAATSFSTRIRFDCDQALRGLRGVKSCIARSSSSVRTTLSIQPKQSASSTAPS